MSNFPYGIFCCCCFRFSHEAKSLCVFVRQQEKKTRTKDDDNVEIFSVFERHLKAKNEKYGDARESKLQIYIRIAYRVMMPHPHRVHILVLYYVCLYVYNDFDCDIYTQYLVIYKYNTTHKKST